LDPSRLRGGRPFLRGLARGGDGARARRSARIARASQRGVARSFIANGEHGVTRPLAVEVAERSLQVADQSSVQFLRALSLDRIEHAAQDRFHSGQRLRERAGSLVHDHAASASRGHPECREVHDAGEAAVGPRFVVQAERGQIPEIAGDQRSRRVHGKSSVIFVVLRLAPEIDLQPDRRVARHLDGTDPLQPLAEKAQRLDRDDLLRPTARHAVLDDQVHRAGEELTAQLRGEVVGGAAADESAHRLAMDSGDDDLGPSLVDGEPTVETLDPVVGAIAVEHQAERRLAGHRGAHLQHFTQAPEAEQPDAVLALRHQLEPFLG